MDFNATIDLIIKDLNEAIQIIDDLKSYPGVPELQVELAKAKCKSAGDVIALLKSIKQIPPESLTDKISKPVVKELPQTEKKETEFTGEVPEPTIIEEIKATEKQVKTRQVVEEKDKPTITKGESSIIADKFINMHSSINEQIGTHKAEDDVTEIHKSKHIHSLKEAIGLNDRFLFIREIFNGNKDAYEQAIARLEHAENPEDAQAVIMSYTGSNTDSEIVNQLLDLVKRKFTPDE